LVFTLITIDKMLLGLALLAFAVGTNAISIGDSLYNSYDAYSPMPMNVSAASDMGWSQYNDTCDPNLGYAWSLNAGGPVEEYPVTLYFTAGGQVAGIGVTVYGQMPQNLIDKGFWQQVGNDMYFVSVTFRNLGMCDGSMSPDPLGDRLIINANSISFGVPTTTDDAVDDQWFSGSCIQTMGTHWSYDLAQPGGMTWAAANMVPVVTMYNGTDINAIFFASPVVQQGLLNRNMWDDLPLPSLLMCWNWCDSSCSWKDTSFWSTMHIFFRDYTTVNCEGGCTVHCCPSDE